MLIPEFLSGGDSSFQVNLDRLVQAAAPATITCTPACCHSLAAPHARAQENDLDRFLQHST
jgi:hypothetical protein